MALKVKVCGITNEKDALLASSLGAWALGFVFYKQSPRFISPSRAQKIIQALPPFVTPVGIFVNQKEGAVKSIADFCGLGALQLHGDETPLYCSRLRQYKIIKAFRVKEDFDISNCSQFKVSAYLFDAYDEKDYGGSGKTFNWDVIKDKKFARPVILSGGLTPENIAEAARAVSSYAVDVSSGVEKSPGQKDGKLLQDFFSAIGFACQK